MRPLNVGDPSAVASYRLVGVLGTGGMGRVYLGESQMGRRVAIKVIHHEVADDRVFRRRFAREVAAARLVSPLYTAAVVDADPDAPAPWLATIYIEGPTLAQLVYDEGPLRTNAVLTLAAGLAEALASIHRVGLVHRDLKPSNVIVNDAGPHLIDFGVAFATAATRLTKGNVVGTPSYIAPENIRGDEPSPAGDIFSLGATLAFAASGQHLVTDGTAFAQMMQIAAGRFDLDAVPDEVRPLVVRCIAANPTDRPTATDLVRLLSVSGVSAPVPGWYTTRTSGPDSGSGSGGPPNDGPSQPADGPQRHPLASRRRVLILGGMLGTVALGSIVKVALGWTGSRRPADPQPTESLVASSRPGSPLWQARSGSTSVGLAPAGQPPGAGIIVAQNKIIVAANRSEVFGADLQGQRVWTQRLPTGLVNLCLWRDAVLAMDARQIWLLNAEDGTEIFAANLAEIAEKASGSNNQDNLAKIGAVALSRDRAAIDLGTETIAIDRHGATIWRIPRGPGTTDADAFVDVPRVANDDWLVTHDITATQVQVTVRHADTGKPRWSVTYEPGPPARGPSGGGGGLNERWNLSEGYLTDDYLALRDGATVQVRGLTDGRALWSTASQTPIAGIAVVADMVVVAAGRVAGHAIGDGAQRWEYDLLGALIAPTVDGAGIIMANDRTICALELTGAQRWRSPLPRAVSGSVINSLTTDEHNAYVTFRPRTNQRIPPGVDVVAVRLV